MSDERTGLTPAAVMALLSGQMENFEAAARPGGIGEMEARGQQALIDNRWIPVAVQSDYKMLDEAEGRARLEGLGLEIIPSYEEGFYDAKLPEGWTLVVESAPYWTRLADEIGAAVALIFYKAAFYDRRSFIRILPPGEV